MWLKYFKAELLYGNLCLALLFQAKRLFFQVLVTEVTQDGKFFAQHVDEGPKLEQLMKQMREEFGTNPPLAGVYQPKRGLFTKCAYA